MLLLLPPSLSTEELFFAFHEAGVALVEEGVDAAAAAAMVAGFGPAEGAGASMIFVRACSGSMVGFVFRSKLNSGSLRSLRAASCKGAVILPFFAVEMMMCSADLICGSNFPSPEGGLLSTRMSRGKL